MPLVSASLASALEGVAGAPPATTAACASAWASAIGDYAATVAPPSSTAAAATAALDPALAAAFATTDAAPLMEVALAAFATTLGGGMAGFSATPPPAPVGLAAQFAAHPPTHAAAGVSIATLIDTWMRTGTATPSAGGTPIAWS